jgi:galactonate dehydratase
MRITDYELYEVPPRWLFLRIDTSEGIVGWGEPVVEGQAKTVQTAVKEILDNYLLGENPLNIEDHWQAMYRGGFYRGGPILMSAIAGINQALWDIKGKRHDVPVYELLGGKSRDKIRIYQWIGGNRPEDVADEAERLADVGYTVLKMDATNQARHVESEATLQDIVERIRIVRERVPDDVDIGVDFRGRISKSMGKALANRLSDVGLMFIEEPVLPENIEHLATVADSTQVPMATGERLYSRWDYKQLFDTGAIDIIQPNISHAGGISEMIKIAYMAEAHDVAVAPNCPLGPIALAASLQVDTHVPNFLVQDHRFDIHSEKSDPAYKYIADRSVFEYEGGYLEPLADPGLGIQIDTDVVEEMSEKVVDWHNPIWRHEDGSIADW